MEVTARPTISLHMVLQIDESEARALDAMSGYGDDAFVKAFYENLGASYMKQHEAGLRKFLKSCRDSLHGPLHRADKAREAFDAKGTT